MKAFFTHEKLRYIFFWLMTACLIGGPVWVVSERYRLFHFNEYTYFKGGLMGLIVATIVVLYFAKAIKGWVKGWKPSVGKSLIDVIIRFLPFGAAWIAIDLFKRRIEEIQQDFTIICWFIVAGLIFKQGHDYYLKIVKKKEELAELKKINEVINP